MDKNDDLYESSAIDEGNGRFEVDELIKFDKGEQYYNTTEEYWKKY